MNLGGIGIMEVLVIILVAVIVLGPARAADMAKSAGKMVREMRRSFTDITTSLEEDYKTGPTEWSPNPDNPERDEDPKAPN